MSAEIADRLRTLAHEHHEGRLDLAAYRALRGPLLDSLSSGASSPPIEITEPRVAHRQMQRDAITRPGRPYVATASEPESATAPGWFGSVPLSDGLAPQGAGSLLQGAGSAPPGAGPTSGGIGSATRGTVSAPQGAGSAPQRTVSAPQGSESMPTLGRSKPLVGVRHRLVVWTAAAMVAVAAGAVWIWLQHRHAGSPEVESGANSATAQPGAARSAVEQFMDGSDWSDGRLAALNATLMELGGEQIAPLTREAGFQRFVDELRRRLKEQQALSPITLTVNNSPLAALAVTVGL